MVKNSEIKRVVRYLSFVLLLAALVFVVRYHKELNYAMGQLKGQLHIVNNTRDIKDCLNDPMFNADYKKKLNFIEVVKQFAEDSLGLKTTSNYTTLYDQDGKDILWNVTASDKYALKAHKWQFPLVGSFSYKGFFDLEKATTEYKAISEQGLDASVRPVSAWSTLGIFKDPILSNMLYRAEGELAELIIHEMTHATLYVKNDVSFNENLATYIGEKGALLFLSWYEEGQPVYSEEYREGKRNEAVWTSFVLGEAHRLDSIYNIVHSSRDSVKAVAKISFYSEFIDRANRERRKIGMADFSLDEASLNNTYFLSYLRYHTSQDELDSLYNHKFQGDFSLMLDYFEERY